MATYTDARGWHFKVSVDMRPEPFASMQRLQNEPEFFRFALWRCIKAEAERFGVSEADFRKQLDVESGLQAFEANYLATCAAMDLEAQQAAPTIEATPPAPVEASQDDAPAPADLRGIPGGDVLAAIVGSGKTIWLTEIRGQKS